MEKSILRHLLIQHQQSVEWNKNEVIVRFKIIYVIFNDGENSAELCFFSQFYSNSLVYLLILMAFII